MKVEDVEGLAADVQACALVGYYMASFAALEIVMDAIIGEILQVRDLRAAIMTRNMGFGEKIGTLRSLVNYALVDRKAAAEADTLLKGLSDVARERNLVAHSGFWPLSGGGVQFAAFSANSTFKFVEGYEWAPAEAIERADAVMTKRDALAGLLIIVSAQGSARAYMTRDGIEDSSLYRLLNLPPNRPRDTDAT